MKLTVLHEALLALHEREGGLTPEVVVQEATAETSPLHDKFTWDDSEAARLHRLNEARELIRSVRILIRTSPETTHRIRAFTHVAPEGIYMPTDQALTEHADVVKEQLLRDIEALRRKYSKLVDFEAVLHELAQPAEAA